MATPPQTPDHELPAAWLERNREALLWRWMDLLLSRSSPAKLAARPIAERVADVELLLEAARDLAPPDPAPGPHELPWELSLRRRDGGLRGEAAEPVPEEDREPAPVTPLYPA